MHLDIAGSVSRTDNYSVFAKGAAGFGVDSLSKFYRELEK
ncbi:MAG: M17 family metallopeptidase [Candidatus Gracilibacteria bacterium]|nr:M17 family metallopeptidase [Candidatus Gracilibacteria bacterium]